MKIYRVMNTFPGEENGRHEYDIHVKETSRGTKYSLIRSKAGHWSDSFKGEKCVSILDTGDDMILSNHITNQLDYALGAELFILMSFINAQGLHNSFFMGTIEEVKQIATI
jgi:hypothetical protein